MSHISGTLTVSYGSARDFGSRECSYVARRSKRVPGQVEMEVCGGSQLRYMGNGTEIWSRSLVRIKRLSTWNFQKRGSGRDSPSDLLLFSSLFEHLNYLFLFICSFETIELTQQGKVIFSGSELLGGSCRRLQELVTRAVRERGTIGEQWKFGVRFVSFSKTLCLRVDMNFMWVLFPLSSS